MKKKNPTRYPPKRAKATEAPVEPAPPPQPGVTIALQRLRHPETAVSLLYLLVLVAAAYYYLLPALFRTWFASSDEYVVVAEVIRFSRLDLQQQFFDMPGTPFIMFVAAVWRVFSALAGGASEFTFQHIEWLFRLTRACTLLFYGVSLILFFFVAQKALNRPGAYIAALLLMMSPIYAQYSSLVRVESMALCFILGALLLVYYAVENRPATLDGPPTWRDPVFLAGILVGLAAGDRLHSIAASAPLLWLILVLLPRPSHQSYPRWVRWAASVGVPLLLAGGTAGYLAAEAAMASSPHAYSLLEKVAVAAASLPLLAACAYFVGRLRPVLLAVVPAAAIKAGLGACLGVIAGIPTLIPQFKFFLASMEMYSTQYIDWQRSSWPLWKNLRWLVSFYVNLAAPGLVALLLLLAGALLVILTRDRKVLPYLGAAVLFFVSKPLNLIAGTHHIIPWLPCYAVICAYPVGQAYLLARSRVTNSFAVNCGFALVLVAIAASLANGPLKARRGALGNEAQLQNVAQATMWMKGHLAPGSAMATAYHCFNSDTFYHWMLALGVSVPTSIFEPGQHMIWWGARRELLGHSGYACLTKPDVEGFKASINPAKGDRADDPYTDPRFKLAARFGSDDREVDVFSFDFREPADAKP